MIRTGPALRINIIWEVSNFSPKLQQIVFKFCNNLGDAAVEYIREQM